MTRTQLILVGGFLGTGKTTLIQRAAQLLQQRGLRVGLVTNDQAGDIVDTALAHTHQLPVVEVSGGCFCCRFADLQVAIAHLQQTIAPDVILAEPVGSCTDLAATVMRPLRAFHADTLQIAPLTILVDPQRDLQGFVAAVHYLYQQQLAEAELIVVAKADTLAPPTLAAHQQVLQQRYPDRPIVAMSAHDDARIIDWLDRVLSSVATPRRLELDYLQYATAEASLGWLNATLQLTSTRPFLIESWLTGALFVCDHALLAEGAAIAHLKMHAQTADTHAKVSVTGTGLPPIWDDVPRQIATTSATVLVNARVSAPPQVLAAALQQIVANSPSYVSVAIMTQDCFQPAPPQPTYRMTIEEAL
jgi:G3E family GTPase